MELMRHSDLKLTLRDYTDETLLPMDRELQQVPTLKSSLISSPKAGKTCPNVSTDGKTGEAAIASEEVEAEDFRVGLGAVDQPCPSAEVADRERLPPLRSGYAGVQFPPPETGGG